MFDIDQRKKQVSTDLVLTQKMIKGNGFRHESLIASTLDFISCYLVYKYSMSVIPDYIVA